MRQEFKLDICFDVSGSLNEQLIKLKGRMSSEGAEGGGDLQTKYKKLAAEYSKVRAQLPVLKRAVIEEQGKNSELSENLHKREQSLRKLEQEVDSLSFRNKQLEKRISVLQDEFSEIAAKAQKSKKGATNVPQGPESSPLDYELITKLEENMKLQKQLSDLEQSTNFEIDTLKSQLESLSNDKTHQQLILTELTAVKEDNKSLTFALQNSYDEIEAYKEQVRQLKETMASLKQSSNNHEEQSQDQNSLREDTTSDVFETENLSKTNLDFSDLGEKLKNSEQQKEYWSLEYQLLKMKYERVYKKWEECKDILQTLGREDLLQLSSSSEVTTPVIEPSNLLGKMEVSIPMDGNNDIIINGRSFEKEVKAHMTKKINELVVLIQLADSRAIHFYNECKATQSLLSTTLAKMRGMEDQVNNSTSQQNELKEELQLTKDNYESQLTQLTEHLAVMNDKFAEKQELINDLQSKLKAKK